DFAEDSVARCRRDADDIRFAKIAIGTAAADLQPRVAIKSNSQPAGSKRPVHSHELKAILLVDDDQQLASGLQWILAEENFLVDIAFDGEEAMSKVKTHVYDAVICDLKMPRMRGDEFYLKAKEMRPSLSDRF